MRTFLKGDQVEHQMRRIVTSTAEAFGTAAQLEYEYKTPPVINEDPQLNRIARGAVVKLYGEEAVQLGLIDQLGGLTDALNWLYQTIEEKKTP